MAKNSAKDAGKAARQSLGLWHANRFLVLRRAVQLSVIGLFIMGPTWGVLTGNLSSSELFGTIPMTDPLLLIQTLATGFWPETTAIIGGLVVIGFYAIAGPRAFCGWICPVNMVTDLANWIRRKTGIKASYQWSSSLRYWLLAAIIVGSAVSNTLLWVWIDPVSALHRGLVFGMGAGWTLILIVFLIDLLLVEHGWCGHLCPLGATYGVIGRYSLTRVTAVKREQCNNCMDCFNVCPEPKILRQPLKQGDRKIMSQDCISCGRCIDVCAERVFEFRIRTGAKYEE
ncbi:quinol dehydrogenase ferredoxin subunit NapH [Vibrio sp. SCSIO 43136]|uniref:quinol dehydrogenase ferredoxin subunit NapH n=1 Tax=Vibrio sp. SCSIO 43136 TaxID=2819101 RepID=UPI002075803A|nr:quinol dehydrogenase ferredoxin subunit NapH [Vibrio sp. SCSIO 43136]USD68011.1 quinol dehydrogenase ferredoxin subunit NapH [Vibrio sp. SCSIO 43136]